MPDQRPLLSMRQVASVFGRLSREHAGLREPADASAAWRRIEFREGARAERAAFVRSWFSWRALVPAVALAATATALVWWSPFGLEYELEGTTAANGLIHTGAETARLTFSDESRIEIGRDSTLSVDVVAKRSALTRLREGKLSVSVQHEDDTDWRFFAGPYEVRVVGTKFDLGWEPDGERLSIAMREGRVRVLGPGIDRLLDAGQKLDFGQAPPRAAELPAAEVEDTRPEPERTEIAVKPRERRTGAPAASAGTTEAWAALVAKGKFTAVIQAAEARGVEQSLAETGSSDLKALAQAARYTGRTPLALRAFQSLRQRFGQHGGGRQAAFFLGRIYDQQGKTAEALRWLNVYLGEAPGDVYASEALGRKLTLVRRVEGDAAAVRIARQYLERFPNGAYARTARSLVAE